MYNSVFSQGFNVCQFMSLGQLSTEDTELVHLLEQHFGAIRLWEHSRPGLSVATYESCRQTSQAGHQARGETKACNDHQLWIYLLNSLSKGDLSRSKELANSLSIRELSIHDQVAVILELATQPLANEAFPDIWRDAYNVAILQSRDDPGSYRTMMLWAACFSLSHPGSSPSIRDALIYHFCSSSQSHLSIHYLMYQYRILSERGLLGDDQSSVLYVSRLKLILKASNWFIHFR